MTIRVRAVAVDFVLIIRGRKLTEVCRLAAEGPTAFGLGRRRGRRLVKPAQPTPPLTAEQRLLLLDAWRRSGLPAADFAAPRFQPRLTRGN